MQFDFFFDMFGFVFIFFIVIFFMVFIFIATVICRAGKAATSGGFVVEPPSFAIPETPRRSDGTEIKTVRLPDRCPSCNAALAHESIDWVGPLEARCTYCGGTVKARFETI